ncbi:hypothetical protein AKJ52_02180 [candidate division MSBL1 archaeon SCGC-AAA382C18]|uniref:Proteasome assembly chaperone family protein n=1 Tax=candidate division MSBL1 archaeon SCGC-AAA382C18 TaxID=1698281 RepID=A0A133VJ79_9EURY|nr:hypothetical protein AKJ52_02180 [candidate division MSBL1 archaeon SCGC-AAA382C18]
MTFEIKYLEKPDLNKPIAIAGLPGIGLIGKVAVEYLIEELDAEKFLELGSDKFPGWAIRENGLVRGLKVYFHHVNIDGFDRDIVLITADAQASSSEGQYELSEKIIDILEDEGVDTVITMAAFLDSEGNKSPVVGAATNKETAKKIEKNGVGLLNNGRIVGMNGLLVKLGTDKKMKGFCLLGTTKDRDKDPQASKEVLSKFSNIYKLDLDLSSFDEKVPDLPKFKPPKIKMPSVSGGESETSYIR